MTEEADPGLPEGWEPQTPEIAALSRRAERENEARQSGREAFYDRPVEERVKAGLAVAEAYCVSTEGDGREAVAVFRCRRNDSRFRPGTHLRVSRGDPRRSVARLELVDDRFEDGQYELRLSGPIENPAALEGPDPWVLDEDAFDLLEVELSLLREAEERGLAPWLSGGEEPRLAPDEVPSPFSEGLTGSSLEAFTQALRARNWLTIQGPPGSGKTHLLARLALHMALERDLRVLVTAVSHAAIHQALAEVVAVGRRHAKTTARAADLLAGDVVKIGLSRGANEGLPDGVRPLFRIGPKKRPVIVGATVYAASRLMTPGVQPFDVVLFDEAGQAPMTLALGARVLAPLALYIGDDMQLPPVVEARGDEDDGEAGSVLSHARSRYGAPFLLRETRRLNDELCAVVGSCFYDDALSSTPEAAGRRLELGAAPAGPFSEILRPDRSLVFVDVPHEGNKALCEPEARWAAALAAEAARCGVPPEEVGIVAPYRAQCNRVRYLLERRRGLATGTVERFQGQEREVIVLSMTSSDPRYIARLAPFLFDPRRLNVAISRARTKAIILGSRKVLMAAAGTADEDAPDSAAARGLAVFRRLVEAAHPVAVGPQPPAPVGAAAKAAEGEAPVQGAEINHAQYGVGVVLARSMQNVDRRRRWVLEVRFSDGAVRQVLA
ncbi:MAG: AAA family ATPase [Elusimicrobia bacterium]|nr:AAA family ATPase [Elusimicrobiota bacterium]